MWPTTRRGVLDVRQDTVTGLARWTTGAAATSRSARKYTAAEARNNIMPTKNIRSPSRSRSRLAPNTYTGALAYANVWTGFACIFGAVPALISLYCSGAARACCYALVVAVFAVWWFIAVDCVNYLLGKKSYTCRGGPLRRPPLCADDKQVPKVRSDSYLVVAFFLMFFAYRQPDFYNSYLARTLGAFSTIFCVQAYRYA